MATTLEELEARVTALEQHEQENRFVLGGRLDAIHFAVGQVHDKVNQVGDDLSTFRAETTERLDRMEGTLGQILARLDPAPPPDLLTALG